MLTARRRGRLAKTNGGTPWGAGVPIVLAMILGFCTSLWFGWEIDKGLGELSLKQQEFASETEMNRVLLDKRGRLLSKENITRKAAVLGLFPPTEKQIRKP